MKKRTLFSIALVLITCAVLWRCSDEGQSLSPQTTTVTFTLDAATGISGRADASVAPASLYISLTNDAGAPVMTYQKVKILPLGNTYVSEPITLAEGSYRITDFLLASDADSILYATPKKGSALEKAVERPLPYRFRVAKNDVNNISMQVLDVSKSAAKDLGYAAFAIETVNPLQISVFARNNDNEQKLVGATGVILLGADTVKRFDLAAAVNTVSFTGPPTLQYTLIISKPGYNIKRTWFTYDALTDIAMKVYLDDEALMVDISIEDTTSGSGFFLTGFGNIWVDWGDGNGFHRTDFGSFYHKYPSPGKYHASVVGDLDNANVFFHQEGLPNRIESINFKAIKNITRLTLALTDGPAVIDLRQNTQLSYLALAGNPLLEHVYLPENYVISYMILAGPNHMTTEAVDEMLTTLYNAVVSTNTHGGTLIVNASVNSEDIIGPPSWVGYSKLAALRDQYGWGISPDLSPGNP